MPSESNVALRVVQALRRMGDLAAVELVDVHVEDLGAVEDDFDLLAIDLNLLEVPLAHGAEVAVLGTHAVVEGAVVLIRLEAFLAGGGLLGVVAVAVDDLELKAVGGGVTTQWGCAGRCRCCRQVGA